MTTLYGDEHVERYLETDGEEGYDWRNGTTILILFTTGRKSGEERRHALIYRDYDLDGKTVQLIVASKGGAPEPPAWFLNLRDNPTVQVQIKGDRFTAHARTATESEQPDMWKHMVEVWPDYEEYQKKTDRPIHVVVLERQS